MNERRANMKKKERLLWFLCTVSVLILICVSIILVMLLRSVSSEASSGGIDFNTRDSDDVNGILDHHENVGTGNIEHDDWPLILVNANNPIPYDFEPRLIALDNGQMIDERILEPLNDMIHTARSLGMIMEVNSGFRCIPQQREMFDFRVGYWMEAGLTYDEAVAQTRRVIAYPGTSEHHLGLAVDIMGECNWEWLRENSAYFGFILRYPAGSEDITGISYEPWHFRYVGVEAAIEITSRGITLEEFLR